MQIHLKSLHCITSQLKSNQRSGSADTMSQF